MIDCQKCGSELPAESNFCPRCGTNAVDSTKNGNKGDDFFSKLFADAPNPHFESCGVRIWSRMLLGEKIELYQEGYISFSRILGPQFPPEKLLAIKVEFTSVTKIAAGRAAAAVVTQGWNLLLASNRRGDIFVTITTDKQTRVLHGSAPGPKLIKSCLELEGKVNQLINQNS